MPSASPSEIQRARELRARMTDAEIHLWMRLRAKQIGGQRFRRQVPVGPYVVDFACLKARLVIEVDGSQHMIAMSDDAERTAALQARGYRVLRFWNNDVLEQTESVLEKIRLVLLETPTLPSPAGGEGNLWKRGGK